MKDETRKCSPGELNTQFAEFLTDGSEGLFGWNEDSSPRYFDGLLERPLTFCHPEPHVVAEAVPIVRFLGWDRTHALVCNLLYRLRRSWYGCRRGVCRPDSLYSLFFHNGF